MPIYEYHCTTCEHKFERLLKISSRKEPESENCESCGKQTIQQNQTCLTPHQYGIGHEARNNAGNFKDVLQKIQDNTKHMGGKNLKETSTLIPL